MASELRYEVCPETGVGCVLIRGEAGMAKVDLMPDEVASLQELASLADLAGIKALLSDVSPSAAAVLDDEALGILISHAS